MRDLFRGLGVSPLIWLASIWLACAAIVFALLYGCSFLMRPAAVDLHPALTASIAPYPTLRFFGTKGD